MSERRTWDNPVRSPWNPKIYNILKSIDLHVDLYLQTGDRQHLEMAEHLRAYVYCLKAWIHREEGRGTTGILGAAPGTAWHSAPNDDA